MSLHPIVIRIRHGDSATDWNIERPDTVSFSDTLDAINLVVSEAEKLAIPAFEYEDEDGDRITVRSEEEMQTMIHEYLGLLTENGGITEPLVIYPRVGKSAGKRNVDGLKVEIKNPKASAPSNTKVVKNEVTFTEDQDSPMDQDQGSSRKKSGDIHEILACGSISDSDLHFFTKVLGSGNCGTVYKAEHKPTSTTLAVKVIRTDCSVDARKQIIAELETLYRCNSPYIISFYGAYFVENRISICAEFMDGGSLDHYGKIPEPVLGRMAVSIVKGLQYLWSLKIMHRDVKPSNVLVNTKGDIKLCDFGVSVQLVESIAKTIVGTNVYMAPEKICGEDYRVQSEVWSLGISLFEMAVGQFPYASANNPSSKPFDLLNSIVGKDPPRLPRGAFSDAFVEFVSNCMQKTPSARPAPEALMKHLFIAKYSDDNIEAIATWIKEEIQQKQLLSM